MLRPVNRVLLATVSLAVVAALCAAPAHWQPIGVAAAQAPKALRRGTASELRSLDPQAVIGNTAGALMYELFEGLVTHDEQGRLVPGVAESWSRSEDGLVYTFRIRPDLRWSDGAPLTAEDFIYSWKRIVDPKNALRGGGAIYPIRNAMAISRGDLPASELGVAAPDPLTLEVHLETPAPFFVGMLASYSTAPVPRHVIEQHGQAWPTPGLMVVNGAYQVREWVTNTRYRLVRNPHYRKSERVSIEEVFYYPIADKGTGVQRFRAGELDVMLDIPPNRLEWAQKNLPDALKVSSALGIRYLLVNNRHPALKDPRVRQALSLAVNREAITAGILKDGSSPVTNLVPGDLEGYGPNPSELDELPYEQRVEMARKLIAEAGYGGRNPLKISLSFLPQENFRRVVVALQSMWRAIGVDLQLDTMASQGLQRKLNRGDYDLVLYTYYAPFSDPTAFLLLLESDSFRNYSGYSNPEFDAMLLKANTIADEQERLEFLRQAERFALAEYPVIPLFNPGRTFLVSPRVRGWYDHTAPHMARHLSLAD